MNTDSVHLTEDSFDDNSRNHIESNYLMSRLSTPSIVRPDAFKTAESIEASFECSFTRR